MRRLYFLLLACCLINLLPAPRAAAQSAKLSLEQQQADFALFRTGLREGHGGLDYYIQPARFQQQFDSVARTFRPDAPHEAYYLKLRYLLTLLGHGHSRINLPQPRFNEHKLGSLDPGRTYLPLQLRILDGRLYVLQDCSAENAVPAGAEILDINGVPVAELLPALARYVPADGRNTTFKYYNLYHYYQLHYLLSLRYPDTRAYRLQLRGSKQPVTLQGQPPARMAQLYQQRTGRGISQYDNPLAYRPAVAPGVAYLKVGSFYKGFVEGFKQSFEPFIDSAFADLQRRGTQHLILDLRNNEGGGDGYADYLFRHLTDRPYQGPGLSRVAGRRFTTTAYARNLSPEVQAFLADPNQFLLNDTTLQLKPEFSDATAQQPMTRPYLGRLYVLTNGGSFSASNYVVGYLLQQRQQTGRPVVFVGEENGGDVYSNVQCAGQSYVIELPNSRITVDMPFLCGGQLNRTPPPKRLPDHHVQPTIAQVLKGQDAEVEFVLRKLVKTPDRGQ